jgi:hypothetical protein
MRLPPLVTHQRTVPTFPIQGQPNLSPVNNRGWKVETGTSNNYVHAREKGLISEVVLRSASAPTHCLLIYTYLYYV